MKKGEHKDIKIPFGKYKGKLIADVPSNYLNWLREQEFVYTDYPELAKQIKIELEFRDKFDKHF